MIGTLKGFDQLMNVVLDDVKEVMRGLLHPLRFFWVELWTDWIFV